MDGRQSTSLPQIQYSRMQNVYQVHWCICAKPRKKYGVMLRFVNITQISNLPLIILKFCEISCGASALLYTLKFDIFPFI